MNWTYLGCAIYAEDPDALILFLKAGANPNFRHHYNDVPVAQIALHHFLTNGRAVDLPVVFSEMLQHGLDPNVLQGGEKTLHEPVLTAIIVRCHLAAGPIDRLVDQFISAGARVDGTYDGNTSFLHQIALWMEPHNSACVGQILNRIGFANVRLAELGGRGNYRDKYGATVIDYSMTGARGTGNPPRHRQCRYFGRLNILANFLAQKDPAFDAEFRRKLTIGDRYIECFIGRRRAGIE